jgi:hypothetical protein
MGGGSWLDTLQRLTATPRCCCCWSASAPPPPSALNLEPFEPLGPLWCLTSEVVFLRCWRRGALWLSTAC